jgi:predicted glycosyltransferase
MVYSHDAYGLGNIRRMLAICENLLNDIPRLSILLLSGSPMLQGFRLPKGIDYIKLPCLTRGETGDVAAKYLDTDVHETVQLRADLILSAACHFKPDLLLVDKKPFGLQDELKKTVKYLRSWRPKTKLVLLLRDILDAPQKTIAEWQKYSYCAAIGKFYDRLLVVGDSHVFNFSQEYQLSSAIAQKVRHCGYLGRQSGLKNRACIRQELNILPDMPLVLVTPGGGEDGYGLIHNYLLGIGTLPTSHSIHSLIFTGPEMSATEIETLHRMAKSYPHVHLLEFTDDLMSYMAAADAVVSMGGYNTICEILSAQKPAIVVPRIKPSQEQLVRAEKMTRLGLFATLHPDQLTPQHLMQVLLKQLNNRQRTLSAIQRLDLSASSQITQQVNELLGHVILDGTEKRDRRELIAA